MPATNAPPPSPRPRLVADDFVALRSLARGSWFQGERIAWRVAGEWQYVTYSEAPALDAADRLMATGLVEERECPCGHCRRATICLTERGVAFVAKMNERPASALPWSQGAVEQEPATVPGTGLLARLLHRVLGRPQVSLR